MEAIRKPGTADRMTILMAAIKKAAKNQNLVNSTPEVDKEDQATRIGPTKAVMANRIIDRMKVPRTLTDNRTPPMRTTGQLAAGLTATHTKAPRAAIDNGMTTLTAAQEGAMVNLRTNHTKQLRAATNDPITRTRAISAVMVDQTTTAPVCQKIHSGTTLPAVADRMIVPTEMVREVMINLDLATTLALIANRRVEAVRGGCYYPVREVR